MTQRTFKIARHFCYIQMLTSFLLISGAVAQNTVGVLVNEEGASDTYTFFSPFSGRDAYMIDQCGRVINKWDRNFRPGLSAYFLDNGLMLRTYKPSPEGPFTSASNSGGLELVDWHNNIIWQYEFNTSTSISHHDAIYMPNGNIMVLTWDLVFRDEIIEMGRDPNEIAPQGFMWSEKIIEFEPIFPDDINIVWQWEIKDHYIQDFDPSKLNYGVVVDHPELYDINLADIHSSNSNASRDWNHFNAIDYNAELDQILISTRNSDEIWILDHSTTTEEAAGHSGGNANKGGDILYRWGNPSAYRAAPVSEQRLFGQHGTHWIRDGLTDAGKILIFNNGNGRFGSNYSTVEIIDPPVDSNGQYFLEADNTYGPEDAEWSYGHDTDERFYSAFLSNAQRLPNGNTLINSGSNGFAFEINPEKEIVWSYEIPLFGDTPATQGQNVNNNASFRVYKYPPDFKGFDNLNIMAGEPIELNPNLINCETTSVSEQIIPGCPIGLDLHQQQIDLNTLDRQTDRVSLFNMQGKLVISNRQVNHLDIGDFPSGLYIIQLHRDKELVCNQKIFIP